MGEISINPKFNIHETYKKVRILNPYRHTATLMPSEALVSYYKLDELSGNPIDFITGLSGVNYGAIQGQDGVLGTSYQFDGTSSYCDLGNTISINNDSTIMFWVYVTKQAKQNPLQYGNYYDWGSINLFGGGDRISQAITFYYGKQGGGYDNFSARYGSDTYPLNAWFNCAIVRDHTDGIYRICMGGITIATHNTLNTAAVPPVGNFIIGDGYQDNLGGKMDELKIFNKALTDEEIQSEM